MNQIFYIYRIMNNPEIFKIPKGQFGLIAKLNPKNWGS